MKRRKQAPGGRLSASLVGDFFVLVAAAVEGPHGKDKRKKGGLSNLLVQQKITGPAV